MARSEQADLSVQIEARVDKLEKSMAKANAIQERAMRQMEKRSQEAAARMEASMEKAGNGITAKFATLGKGAFAGIAAGFAGIGVSTIVQGYRDIATSVANIGNEAKRAGLSTKAFQELSFVATQTRIPVDAIVDGMKELSLRADEYLVTGSGSAAESFRRLNYSAGELKEKLKDPSALFTEIIGKLEKMDKAARIRIADELFGGEGGERFVELVDQGSAGIRQMIKDANDLGLVLDEKMIKQADEIDRKFSLLSQRVGVNLKSAILEATDALGDFLDKFRDTQDQTAETLRKRIQANFQQQADYRRQLADYQEQGVGRSPATQNLEAELRILDADYKQLQSALDRYTGQTDAAGGKVDRLGQAADNAASKLGGVGSSTPSFRQSENASMTALGRFNDAQARTMSKKGMLDLIGYAEGTDRGRGYNETLGFGAFTGGDVNLTAMTLKEVLALQRKMLADPNNKFNSSAVGRYQIVSKTMKGLMGEMGLSGDEFFSPALQDRMAEQLLRRRGNNIGGLRNEWEGLRRVPDDAIQTALGTTQQTMAGRDEGVQASIDKKKELADSYREIVNQSVAFIAGQNAEASAIGMTELQVAKLRYEQELLNQASAANLTVTPQMREQFSQLAQGMAEAEASAKKLATSQEEVQRTAEQFRGIAQDATSGLVRDLLAGKSAGEAFASTLSRIADQLIDMAVSKLFENAFAGTGGGAGGAGLFSVVGKLFGFANGGIAANGRPQALPMFAKGGVSRSAAIFGEAGPEAAVPLPDGRSIPVTLSMPRMPTAAGSVSNVSNQVVNVSPTINVQAAQGGDAAANDKAARATAKAVEDTVRATVQQELQRAMKPGGIMRNGR